jgi:hypothetical protein
LKFGIWKVEYTDKTPKKNFHYGNEADAKKDLDTIMDNITKPTTSTVKFTR